MRSTALALCLFSFAVLLVFGAGARPVQAAASVTLASGFNETRTTIPVTVEGVRASCVLDTGSSVMLVSPALAREAGLQSQGGTFEIAPDGRTYADRQTVVGRFTVAGSVMRNVPALISANLSGSSALCGYDFFAHFPTLIDRYHRTVTLFPSASKVAHLHCLPVALAPRVPLATVEINGTWLDDVVLDSGMAGGGALWDGVRSRLSRPLIASADYTTNQSAVRNGFACGASAWIRYAAGAPETSMPICTEPRRPDGYNGIIETNLSSVHAMAVDYPRKRICFDVAQYSPGWAAAPPQAQAQQPPSNGGAWSRFNSLRPPL
ncbi:MAG TPA: retropepsin-like aspartic protease [Candidatus Cybelea sp.]|jgi:hypothetical protein